MLYGFVLISQNCSCFLKKILNSPQIKTFHFAFFPMEIFPFFIVKQPFALKFPFLLFLSCFSKIKKWSKSKWNVSSGTKCFLQPLNHCCLLFAENINNFLFGLTQNDFPPDFYKSPQNWKICHLLSSAFNLPAFSGEVSLPVWDPFSDGMGAEWVPGGHQGEGERQGREGHYGR